MSIRNWPAVQLGNQHLLEAADDLAQVRRQRIQIPQVRVRHAEPPLARTWRTPVATRAVGAAPTDDQQLAAGRAVDFLRRNVLGHAGHFAARKLTMCS